MSFLRGVFGSGASTPSISAADTIERLCDRVQSSSLLDDRRDAVKAIKSLSKKYKLEVGTQAMDILIDVLQKDRTDSEICGYALDTLYNIMTVDAANEDEQKNLPDDITVQFTEVYIKNNENVILLTELLDEFEFRIRWSTVKLLNVLIENHVKKMQESILVCPMGISKLMDLLADSREIIRNDTLLLLQNLTKTPHANIQKIVAFENGFERILDIIDVEGGASLGGIVVEDCFNLILNLLKTNSSNQNFFKEGNFIKRLCKFFEIDSSATNGSADDGASHHGMNDNWQPQKIRNFYLLLEIVRTLVSPVNQQQIVNSCQKAINYCGLLHRLCAILMISGVPVEILTETISTVAEVIRGNEQNQQFFSTVMAPSQPPRQLLIVLLMSMINEKQTFQLRYAIFYCVQCYLYRNEQAQASIIETLLPNNAAQNADQQQITTGQLLCGGLFNSDSLSNWLCACVLLHSINDNKQQKEQLLRVQLTFSANETITLMQQCMNLLQSLTNTANVIQAQSSTNKFQTITALLMFLCTWLVESKACVNCFLSNQSNVTYLISQISSTDTDEKYHVIQGLCAFLLGICIAFNSDQVPSYTTETLKDTINKRIGIEQFEDKLEYISQSEAYTKALQKPVNNFTNANQLLYDYEFTRLFKLNETSIIKILTSKSTADSTSKTFEEHNDILMQYKQIIREQDQNMNLLRSQLADAHQQTQTYMQSYRDLENNYQFLKDQNALLKATQNGSKQQESINGINAYTDEINKLKSEIENLRLQNTYYTNELQSNGSPSYPQNFNSANSINLTNYLNEIENLKSLVINEQMVTNELRSKLDMKDNEINVLRSQYFQLQQEQIYATANTATATTTVNSHLACETSVNELKSQLNMLQLKFQEQADSLGRHQREKVAYEEKLANYEQSIQNFQGIKQEYESYEKRLRELNDDQENLLALLQEMEGKYKKYRNILKTQYGYTNFGHDDDDDDDDEDEDDLQDDEDLNRNSDAASLENGH